MQTEEVSFFAKHSSYYTFSMHNQITSQERSRDAPILSFKFWIPNSHHNNFYFMHQYCYITAVKLVLLRWASHVRMSTTSYQSSTKSAIPLKQLSFETLVQQGFFNWSEKTQRHGMRAYSPRLFQISKCTQLVRIVSFTRKNDRSPFTTCPIGSHSTQISK